MAPLLCPIDIGGVRRLGSCRGNRKRNESPLAALESTRLEHLDDMAIIFLNFSDF